MHICTHVETQKRQKKKEKEFKTTQRSAKLPTSPTSLVCLFVDQPSSLYLYLSIYPSTSISQVKRRLSPNPDTFIGGKDEGKNRKTQLNHSLRERAQPLTTIRQRSLIAIYLRNSETSRLHGFMEGLPRSLYKEVFYIDDSLRELVICLLIVSFVSTWCVC